jgi:hypothetical protein
VSYGERMVVPPLRVVDAAAPIFGFRMQSQWTSIGLSTC